MPRSYPNLQSDELATELHAANQVGFAAIEVPSPRFDALASHGVPMIYVLVEDRLLVSRRRIGETNITHAALSNGMPVQAAGECTVESHGSTLVVTALNNMSGHYQPGVNSLAVAREAFESRGVRVNPNGVLEYPWRGS